MRLVVKLANFFQKAKRFLIKAKQVIKK